jgi:ABC-type sugar transport system permease subunit
MMADLFDAIPWVIFFSFMGGMAVVAIPLALAMLLYRPMPLPRPGDLE